MKDQALDYTQRIDNPLKMFIDFAITCSAD